VNPTAVILRLGSPRGAIPRSESCRAGWLGLVLVALACGPAPAQFSSDLVSARSYSGQFLVQAPAALVSAPAPAFERDTNFLRLEPSVMMVCCERVKQSLWRELGVSGPWSGKVFVQIYQAVAPDDAVTFVAEEFRDGWQYRLALPNVIQRTRLLDSLVRVVLLELANRNASGKSAELPPWLLEGLSEQLSTTGGAEIFIATPKVGANGLGMTAQIIPRRDLVPLADARARLAGKPVLSFEELSWPAEEVLSGGADAFYRANAHLFVTELLRLNDGRACLRRTIAELPSHYNWQFAFLRGFAAHFQRPLEVEKWWTLVSLHFTGRELSQAFSADDSWEKLDQLIRSSTVQVHGLTNQMPSPGSVRLQMIVRDWDRSPQQQVLRQKISDLEMLRPRLSENLVPVTDEYLRVLNEFVKVEPSGVLGLFGKQAADRRWREKTVKELDRLDQEREGLRSTPSAPPKATLQAGRLEAQPQ
jgi:hypothetical protein